MAPPVFKTGLAANIVAGGFDSLPPPPVFHVIFGPYRRVSFTKYLRHGQSTTGSIESRRKLPSARRRTAAPTGPAG